MAEELEDKATQMYKKENESMDLKREVDTFAMIGFWLSITSIPFIAIYFIGLIFSIIALILGIIGIFRINADKTKKGIGYAITAVVIAGLFILIGLFIILIINARTIA